MLKVALTGGIATGKSYVLARLKDRGIPTIDADDIVHEALGPGTVIAETIRGRFGDSFLKADGSVDRARLAAEIFSHPEARRQLEALVHPVVYEAIGRWFDALNRPLGVASIPLLYETDREQDFDFVVVTSCPPDVQRQRLLERGGISEEQAEQRIAAQLPAEEKAARGDYVIRTGGSMPETDRQVDDLRATLNARL
jgi:dephospho-CoA kinase